MRKLLLFNIIILAFSACTNKNVYTDFCSFKSSKWDADNVCRFSVEINDTLTPHYFSVLVRHNDNYPYRNLWLFIDITTPSGAVRCDTLKCELADNMGKWFGKGISIYRFQKTYENPIRFPQSGTYTFSIRQGMRDNVLKNISAVGIKLTAQ